jgi:hypothetical protein
VLEEELPLLPLLLGGVDVALESLLPDAPELGVELELLPPLVAPPEAEPELDLSLDGSVALEEPDAPGVAVEPLGAVLELPLEGEVDEDELEPELEGGGVVVLLLELPVVPLEPLPVPLSWPQAARPKAIATATASVENFMSPPWLVCLKRVQQSSGRA